MVVIRFKVTCKPEKAEEVGAAMEAVVGPSRGLDGVLSFDIGRDLTDPNSFIATEVFEGRGAVERQEAQPEVAKVLGLLEDSLAAEPEATLYEVSSSEPWGG
jgi:quinol monooxygenase YgiN